MKRKQKDSEVFRITGARQGLEEDVRGRQRRYVISMLIRTVAVILTVVLWNVERPLAIITLIVGMILPYVAVIIANAGRENARETPPTFIDGTTRGELGARPEHGTERDGHGADLNDQEGARPTAPPYERG